MKAPSLFVTEAARQALLAYLDEILDFEPLVAVVWSLSSSSGRLLPDGTEKFEFLGPGWSVGFHDSEKIPANDVASIGGIPFVFGNGEHDDRLNGATLDFVERHFVVTEQA